MKKMIPGKYLVIIALFNICLWKSFNVQSAAILTKDDVRLVGGARPYYGRVELRYEGEWGTVCSNSWDFNDAKVVCGMLGYAAGTSVYHTLMYRIKLTAGSSSSKIWLSEVKCSGYEDSISRCPHRGWGDVKGCTHAHDAGVICLNNGHTFINGYHFGNIRIWGSVGWRSVCSDGWDDVDATVACREFGWSAGEAFAQSVFNRYTDQIWTNVACNGSESKLSECPHTVLSTASQCAGYHTAGVICYDKSTTYRSSVELRTHYASDNCPNHRCGRAFVVHKNIWGTICDDDWTTNDATVLCKTKGYDVGIPFCCGAFYWSGYPMPVWFRDVACTGSENTIFDCPAAEKNGNNFAVGRCRHHLTDVGALCYNTNDPEFDSGIKVRLVAGDGVSYGRVEVKYRGLWGRVADKNWTETDALVVCREINPKFKYVIPICCSVMGYTVTRPVLMFDVKCQGNESSLVQCSHAGWANQSLASTFKNGFDVGVRCLEDRNQSSTEYKISTGRFGLALLTYGNLWGAICKTGWGNTEANLFCKQVGYAAGMANSYPSDASPIWTRDVDCSAKQKFADCSYKGWVINDCGNNKASVLCYNNAVKRLRLRGGGPTYGRLEIAVDDEWGTICHHGFHDSCANLACHEFGFSRGKMYTNARFGMGTGRIWKRYKGCGAADKRLWEQEHYGWGYPIHCSHGHDISVFCYEQQVCTQTTVELSGAFGHVLSGSWPSAYPVNCQQNWRITVQAGFRVLLAFNEFKIAKSVNCTNHSLKAYDGPEITSPLIGSYCGQLLPFTVWATNNTMFVSFQALGGSSEAGFAGIFTAECIGRPVWNYEESSVTIVGRTFETIENVTSLKDCFDKCDTSEDLCLNVYLDRSSKTCYLYLPNYYGWQNFSVSGLNKFKRVCQTACGGTISWQLSNQAWNSGSSGINDVMKLSGLSVKECKRYCRSGSIDCRVIAYASVGTLCYIKTSNYVGLETTSVPDSGITSYIWYCFDCKRKSKHSAGRKLSSTSYRIAGVKSTKLADQCYSFCSPNVDCKSLVYNPITGDCQLYTESVTSANLVLASDPTFDYVEFQCGVKTGHMKCQDGQKVINSYKKNVDLSLHGFSLECVGECQKDPLCNSVTLHGKWKTDLCHLHYHYLVAGESHFMSSSGTRICDFVWS